MKAIIDLLPSAAFVLAYNLAPKMGAADSMQSILFATKVTLVATVIALAITYIRERKLALIPLVTAAVLFVFGGMTLVLKNDIFIHMKPTFVNLFFAVGLLVGLSMDKLLLKHFFSFAFKLPDHAWRTLTVRYAVFFVFLAGLNEFIWRTQSNDFWVNFKLLGMTPLSVMFMMSQIFSLRRFIFMDAAAEEASKPE